MFIETIFDDKGYTKHTTKDHQSNQHQCEVASESVTSTNHTDTLLSVHQKLEVPSSETRTYSSRFYILAVFSLTAFMQYCSWNTFGPISSTCMEVFDWSESEIAVMASLDPITYLFSIYLFSWMMDVKGK